MWLTVNILITYIDDRNIVTGFAIFIWVIYKSYFIFDSFKPFQIDMRFHSCHRIQVLYNAILIRIEDNDDQVPMMKNKEVQVPNMLSS